MAYGEWGVGAGIRGTGHRGQGTEFKVQCPGCRGAGHRLQFTVFLP